MHIYIYIYILCHGPQVTQVCCQHWLMYCYQLPAMPSKVGCWVLPLGSCWKDNEFFVHFMNLVMPWQHFFNNRFVISQVLDGVWQLCQHLHQIRHHCKSWEPPDIMRNYINWYKSWELCKINWHTQELQEMHKKLHETCRKHVGNIQETWRKPAGNLQDTCRKHAGNKQKQYRKHAGNLQETCRKLPGKMQETCRKHAGKLAGNT